MSQYTAHRPKKKQQIERNGIIIESEPVQVSQIEIRSLARWLAAVYQQMRQDEQS